MVGSGYRDKEIAHELGLSIGHVKNEVSRILRFSKTRNRYVLIARWGCELFRIGMEWPEMAYFIAR
jgi:DNA-binding NarL/FixJ family response regulator